MQSFFNLPREFASTILSAVFISPHINAKIALDELYMVVNCLKTTNPDDLFIIAGDFNQATLKNMLSRYHQHVSSLMKHVNTLDYYYTTIRYLSLHLSPSFQSVWSFVGAAHAGLQTKVEARAIKEENNAVCEEIESLLRDCLESVKWNVYPRPVHLAVPSVVQLLNFSIFSTTSDFIAIYTLFYWFAFIDAFIVVSIVIMFIVHCAAAEQGSKLAQLIYFWHSLLHLFIPFLIYFFLNCISCWPSSMLTIFKVRLFLLQGLV